MKTKTTHRAFSLVELVIVIVIIGVISAIAIPRLTRGATNAGAAALKQDLATMRNAIELYRAEHEGKFPTSDATLTDQLTKYTKVDGTGAQTTVDVSDGIIYGPYLKAVPSVPVGPRKGATGVGTADGEGIGWLYDATTGDITANTGPSKDNDGVAYSTY